MSSSPSVYPILHNCRYYVPQRLQSRPGMVGVQLGYSAEVHSLRRLNDPFLGTFTRLVGSQGNLFLSSSLTPIDSGYSGKPLSMVPFRPANSPQTWMYVADAARMRKVRVDGLNYQMGIAPPLQAPSAEIGVPAVNSIDDFEAVGSWVNGGTAGALSVISRSNFTPDSIVFDSNPNVGGTGTGWGLVGVGTSAAPPPGFFSGLVIGDRLTATQSGVGSEIIQIYEIIPQSFSVSVAASAIQYDSGSMGLCTITFSIPPTAVRAHQGYVPEMDESPGDTSTFRAGTTNSVGLRRNSLLAIGNLSQSELVRVLAVSPGPNGAISVRCFTRFSHVVPGTNVASIPSFRAYFSQNYIVINQIPFHNFPWLQSTTTFSDNALQSTISTGTGTISEVTPLNLGVVAGQQVSIQEDDYISLAFLIDDASNLTEVRLIFDVDSSINDFQHTYYFKSYSPNDIQQALTGAQTIQAARQASFYTGIINSNLGNLPPNIAKQLGAAIVAPPNIDPATIQTQPGGNIPTTTPSQPIGLSRWVNLRCKVSDLTKVGTDASATLASVAGVRIQITVAATAVCAVDSLWLGGCYGPDIGDVGVPYLYRYQPRSSQTGAKGYPSPPTRVGIQPQRQIVVVSMTPHPDPQVDMLDVYRWGGTLPQWTYVGSVANSVAVFEDVSSDLDIQSSPALSFDNLQPFPTVDIPRSGTCNVFGTTVIWVSGAQFNPQWAQGTQINIGGIFYTFYAQPSSATQVEIVENGGTQTGVSFTVQNATILGQPLPVLWGPYSQGTALYLFACGDTFQPGVLFLTNGNDPDSASDVYQIEITSPSEPLMNGCLYNGQSYLWSSDRMFFLYPSFGSGVIVESGSLLPASGTNLFVPLEVPNGKGLFARYAICAGPKIWFRGRDGIYETTGGEPRNITSGELALLFPHDGQPGQPVTVGTFTIYPPDDTQLSSQRLSYYDSNLYFDYLDTQGNQTTLVANTQTSPYVWSKDDYSPPVTLHYGEEGEGIHSLLLGSRASPRTTGGVWQALGTVDGNDSAIAFEARMPQMSEQAGGFQHIRQGYLGLIESASASLIINVDGTDNIVALPSVSGSYARIYVPLPALKGRLFAWALTGLSPFSVFLRDCEVSMKTWADPAYGKINPFSSNYRAAQGKVG